MVPLDVQTIGVVKDKLWKLYPTSTLDPRPEYCILRHQQGDLVDLRKTLGQKLYNTVMDNATYYCCKANSW